MEGFEGVVSPKYFETIESWHDRRPIIDIIINFKPITYKIISY